MKCVNCSNEAIYSLTDPGVNPLDYCGRCLPPHLSVRANEGRMPLRKIAQPAKPKAPEPKED